MKRILTLAIIGLILILMIGCSSNKQNTPIPAPQPNTGSSSSTTIQKVFTLNELKKYNGQNGSPAYVAVDGIVYNVTNNPKWINGKHQGVTAGNDLSKAIMSSPHGKSVLKELPVVGKLK